MERKKADLVNNEMREGFHRSGISVPAAPHDPGIRTLRPTEVSDAKKAAAAEKRRRRAERAGR